MSELILATNQGKAGSLRSRRTKGAGRAAGPSTRRGWTRAAQPPQQCGARRPPVPRTRGPGPSARKQLPLRVCLVWGGAESRGPEGRRGAQRRARWRSSGDQSRGRPYVSAPTGSPSGRGCEPSKCRPRAL